MHTKKEKTVVGLTGGIGSGKSTALMIFQELGWSVISADKLAGNILNSNKSVILKIQKRWGGHLINNRGSIDKAAVATLVFREEPERKWLESILHPIIRSEWISFVQSCPSQKCMIELPLLFENNLQNHFTSTIATFAPLPMIFKRLQDRGLSLDESQARIQSQFTIFSKINLADFVLWGGGSHDFLNSQIVKLEKVLSP